jgi:D-beta-D-heptose 7-phosphate kinase/D-beta-D-heptose 1-phosphate adenosyltransferase
MATDITDPALLDAFLGVTVAVVGDAILDAYLDGEARQLSREAPVPVVDVAGRSEAAGGAANVAVNIAALGGRARLVSVLGRDPPAESVLEIARDHGVDLDGVVFTPRRQTPAKRRILADGQMLVRVDEGTNAPLEPRDERRLAAALARQLEGVDAIVVSDYRCGVVSDTVLAELARRDTGLPLIVDAKDLRRLRSLRPTVCTPSFAEVSRALGGLRPDSGAGRAEVVALAAARVLDVTGAEAVVTTLDRDGAVVVQHDRAPHRVYAAPAGRREPSATGAGDTFTAALTLALVTTGDAIASAELASAAAGVVVGKPGTATCAPGELRRRLSGGTKLIGDAAQLAAEGERHRREGRRIVFANGCFDILHRGHVALLSAAKELGDVLVVAVNSDDSVRRLKGPPRPINSVSDRIEVLASLSCVDHLIVFDGDQPVDLIRALRPDLLVKGGDYTPETVPEAPLVRALGGEVRIVELLADHSTTRILERAGAGGE